MTSNLPLLSVLAVRALFKSIVYSILITTGICNKVYEALDFLLLIFTSFFIISVSDQIMSIYAGNLTNNIPNGVSW